MKVHIIPLRQRIGSINKGYCGEPDYITSTIYTLANTQIGIYLNQHLDELKMLIKQMQIMDSETLNHSYEEVLNLTYREFAIIISEYIKQGHFKIASIALNVISLPIRKYYEERWCKTNDTR